VNGDLLDRSGPYPLVERVEVGLEIDGQEQPPVIVGEKQAPGSLTDRSERAQAIESEVRRILRNGARARIIADKVTATARLIGFLEGARDELCILDRFFGQHLEEWRLLDSVSVPIRVLTGKLEKNLSGGVAVPTFRPNVTVRYRPKAPIHERIYVWSGGGIVLGGSPSTFGESPLRISRLRDARSRNGDRSSRRNGDLRCTQRSPVSRWREAWPKYRADPGERLTPASAGCDREPETELTDASRRVELSRIRRKGAAVGAPLPPRRVVPCWDYLVRLSDRPSTSSMSLSTRDIELLSIAVVDRLAQERRSRNIRWLKWSISILSLLFAAVALVLELL
jgi:hypothetical protein